MKFTEGPLAGQEQVAIAPQDMTWRYRIDGDEVEVLVPCREIRGMHDTTKGSCLTFRFSAPRDMIAVKGGTFCRWCERGPYFGLNLEKPDVVIEDGEDAVSMTSGRLKAVILKKGISVIILL